MPQHLQNALDALKRKVLFLGAVVEGNLRLAVESVGTRDSGLAARVMSGDAEVDRMEVDVEEECLKILALHQPVAADLRFIVATIKLNSDLERISDQAANIAEHAAYLAAHDPIDIPAGIHVMADKAAWMVKSALDSLVNRDAELARRVCAADDDLDALKREMLASVEDSIAANPAQLDLLMRVITITRKLERIGDHATNIAEDVIYMAEGGIVRHLPSGGSQPR